MNNILCKIRLHKWRKVKSTETTRMDIMIDILKINDELFAMDEDIICKKFGMDKNGLLFNYEVYDYVCIRPGCNCYDPKVARKRKKLIEKRNQIVRKEINDRNKNRLIENIYNGCKNGR